MLQKVAAAASASGDHAAARTALDEAASLLEGFLVRFAGESFYEYRMLIVLAQTAQVDSAAGESIIWSCGRIASAGRYFRVAARLAAPEPDWDMDSLAPLAASPCLT